MGFSWFHSFSSKLIGSGQPQKKESLSFGRSKTLEGLEIGCDTLPIAHELEVRHPVQERYLRATCAIPYESKEIHRKIKGQFRKRAVLANVLSFRFLGCRIISNHSFFSARAPFQGKRS